MRKFFPFLAVLILSGLAGEAQSPPYKDADLVSVDQGAAHLKGALFVHVGFPVLYRAAHITGSVYAGPGSKAEGIELLKKTLEGEKRDREIVIYCGCCPWEKCPNVRPALEAIKGMGFTHVRAMVIPENFKTNWSDKGLPTDKRAQ